MPEWQCFDFGSGWPGRRYRQSEWYRGCSALTDGSGNGGPGGGAAQAAGGGGLNSNGQNGTDGTTGGQLVLKTGLSNGGNPDALCGPGGKGMAGGGGGSRSASNGGGGGGGGNTGGAGTSNTAAKSFNAGTNQVNTDGVTGSAGSPPANGTVMIEILSSNAPGIVDLGTCASLIPTDPPGITVKGNGNAIANRALTVTVTDDTDFGAISLAGDMATHTFTIENATGSLDLNLDGLPLVEVAGRDQGDFIVTQPVVSTIAGGGSTTFDVKFDPSATGLRSAIIIITHNDLPDNPFVFTVQGEGL